MSLCEPAQNQIQISRHFALFFVKQRDHYTLGLRICSYVAKTFFNVALHCVLHRQD